MLTYDYRCKTCGRKFSLPMTVGQHDSKRTTCPRCKSRRVTQQVGSFFCVTSDKS